MMLLVIVSLVRMLLVVHDVERNPDPAYTYMMSQPTIAQNVSYTARSDVLKCIDQNNNICSLKTIQCNIHQKPL